MALQQGSREQRIEERVPAEFQVTLKGNATGTTRDISPSGIFFETDAAYAPGSVISFAIDFDTPGGKMVLNCQGEIVRVEERSAKLGFAVRILDSKLRPAETAQDPLA